MRILMSLYLIFSFLMIFVYFDKKRFHYYVMAILAIVLISCARYLGLQILDTFFILGAFLISTISIKGCKDLFESYKANIKERMQYKRETYGALEKENEEIINKKKLLDKRSFALSQIYEIIKKMSGVLKTEEIVSMLSFFLNENYQFSKCHLVILAQEVEKEEIKKLYEIKKGETNFYEISSFDDMEKWKLDLIDFAKKRKIAQTINRSSIQFEQFGIKEPIEHVTLIPLTVEEKLTAVLLIEDLKLEHLEDFLILSSQLVLELKKVSLYESVEKLSITDGLTEIYLRRYFTDRLFEEIKRSGRLKLKFSVLMIDIDHFKRCNDVYGHMVGDVVLREIASIIKSSVREIDLVARYGGEEFTVLLPETGEDGAFYVAERIRKAIENQLITAYDENLKLTVSIGISVYPKDATNSELLIEKSDKAMYLSKQEGRNRVTTWK